MADIIQFDQVETGGKDQPGSLTCVNCKRPISDVYFTANGKIICDVCRAKIQHFAQPSAKNDLEALARGGAAALAGAALYYAVRVATGYNIGLIAIVVGYMVGKSVRVGSKGMGGARYQGMAVVLTYLAIVLTYVPYLWPAFTHAFQTQNMPHVFSLAAFAVIFPLKIGLRNPLGLFIIGIALWEAWKLTRPVTLTILGPFKVGQPR